MQAGFAARWARRFPVVLGLLFVLASRSAAAQDYPLGPDSQFNPAVPHGTLTRHTLVSGPDSIFPGTVRDYWVYVPAQYTDARPAALMVFQDGGGYVSTNGAWRVPWVFDNLIARGEMPVTVGVFVNPGVVPSVIGTNALPRFNRSLEYDGLGDAYAAFLAEELLPEVVRERNVLISPDPSLRAIGGASSGAIAAFTAAWERPDLFRRVFSTIGTYVGLRGGNDYPTLVRKFEPRPIRVFLQDGYNDLNIYGGNWWVANQDMHSALTWAGYAVTNAWGTGGHNSEHGASILPAALKWLWQDAGLPVAVRYSTNSPVGQVTVPGAGWELVGDGYGLPGGFAVNAKGEVFFADPVGAKVHRVALDGTVKTVRTDSGGVQALSFRPDGGLLGTVPDARRIVLLRGDRDEDYVANDTFSKDLVTGYTGYSFFCDPQERAVKRMDPRGNVSVVDTGIGFPAGVCLSPDQSLLLVSDLVGQSVYSFQIQNDGSLAYRQAYHHLHLPDDPRGSGADGMTVDTEGRLWVATSVGVQFCDQAGRVNGILAKPEPGAWATDVCFGGRDRDELYLAAGRKVWKRKMRVRGVLAFEEPVLPPRPRL